MLRPELVEGRAALSAGERVACLILYHFLFTVYPTLFIINFGLG